MFSDVLLAGFGCSLDLTKEMACCVDKKGPQSSLEECSDGSPRLWTFQGRLTSFSQPPKSVQINLIDVVSPREPSKTLPELLIGFSVKPYGSDGLVDLFFDLLLFQQHESWFGWFETRPGQFHHLLKSLQNPLAARDRFCHDCKVIHGHPDGWLPLPLFCRGPPCAPCDDINFHRVATWCSYTQ